MVEIVPEGNINKSKTFLWTRGKAEGLIKGSRVMKLISKISGRSVKSKYIVYSCEFVT